MANKKVVKGKKSVKKPVKKVVKKKKAVKSAKPLKKKVVKKKSSPVRKGVKAKSSKGMINKGRPAAGKIRRRVLAPGGVKSEKAKGAVAKARSVGAVSSRGVVAHVVHASGGGADESCKACEVSEPKLCPMCSRESLILIGAAIILIAVNYKWTRYLAWACLLAAVFMPSIKQYFRTK